MLASLGKYLLIAALVVPNGGCISPDPYIRPAARPAWASPNDQSQSRSRLALQRVQDDRKTYDSKHHNLVNIQRGAQGITFLGALGSPVSALYKAHRDTILGLALVAGAAYSYDSLFIRQHLLTLYATASDKLGCVENTSSAIVENFRAADESWKIVRTHLAELNQAISDAKSLKNRIDNKFANQQRRKPDRDYYATLSKGLETAIADAMAVQQMVNLKIDQATLGKSGIDGQIAALIDEKHDDINSQVRLRIQEIVPKTDEILKKAELIVGASMPQAPKGSEPPKVDGTQKTIQVPQFVPTDFSLLSADAAKDGVDANRILARLEFIAGGLKAFLPNIWIPEPINLDNFRSALAKCTIDLPSLPSAVAIGVEPAGPFELSKNKPAQAFRGTGGSPPYVLRWMNGEPSNTVLTYDRPISRDFFELKRAATVATETEYTFIIQDSGSPTQFSKAVTVKIYNESHS